MSTPSGFISGAALVAAALVFHAWYPSHIALENSEYARQHRENWIDQCVRLINRSYQSAQIDWGQREEICGKGYAQTFPNGPP